MTIGRRASARHGPLRPRARAAVLCALLGAGCVVVPRTAEVYDPQCRTFVRQVVLETAVLGTIGHCHNEGCAAVLATLGLVTAASAVVSGSVAIIGNIVYWAERRGQCPPQAAARPDAQGSSAASAGRGMRMPPAVVPGLVPFAPAPPPAAPALPR